MFCEKCGNQIKEDAVFCSNCGNRLAGEASDKAISEPKEVKRKRKKGGILKYVLIGIGVLTVACIYFLWSGGNNTENIDLVRNGFLGEYTDVTVEELLNTNLGLSGFHLKWAEAEMDGKDYVGFYSYMEGRNRKKGLPFYFRYVRTRHLKCRGMRREEMRILNPPR